MQLEGTISGDSKCGKADIYVMDSTGWSNDVRMRGKVISTDPGEFLKNSEMSAEGESPAALNARNAGRRLGEVRGKEDKATTILKSTTLKKFSKSLGRSDILNRETDGSNGRRR